MQLEKIIDQQALRFKQQRILIVDDEAFNLVGLKMMIKTLRRFKGITKLIDTANDG